MKVILLQELKGRGGEGDVVDVARGFAVNYLLPRKLAVDATSGNLKQLDQRKHNIEKREDLRVGNADGMRNQLEGKTVTVVGKAGDEGRLLGSITTPVIEAAIREQLGVEVDRRKIETHGHIKVVGPHTVAITIYRDIKAELTVNVVAEGAVPKTVVTETEGLEQSGEPFVEMTESAAEETPEADEAEGSDEAAE